MELGPARIASGRLLPRYRQMMLFQTLVVSDSFAEATTTVARYLYYALHFLKSFRFVFSQGVLASRRLIYIIAWHFSRKKGWLGELCLHFYFFRLCIGVIMLRRTEINI